MTWLPALLLAPFVGSFLGALIRRMPEGEPVILARSHCETCRTPLGPAELVPLLSYAAQRGRCRHCQAPIPPFHWHVELAALLVPATAALAGLDGATLWASCAAGWTLLCLAWIDAETLLLPDVLTLPLLLAGLLATHLLDSAALADHALAAGLGWSALWAVGAAYRRLRGREGLGAGDGKLLAALGAWTGLPALPSILLFAALGGLAWAAIQHCRGQPMTATTTLPFGPFLALSGWLVLLLTWR